MSHGPVTDWGEDKAAGKKSRLGIQMFIVYALVYAGFVIANTIEPSLMEIVIFGQNIAVLYGIGLIGFALFLALIYNHVSTKAEEQMNEAQPVDEEEAA